MFERINGVRSDTFMDSLEELKASVRSQIEDKLAERAHALRDRNAIDVFFGILDKVPGANLVAALRKVFTGAQDALEIERERLTVSQILDLVIAIDQKLSGMEPTVPLAPTISILIEHVVATGDITGIDGRTSDQATRKAFEHPIDVRIRAARAGGNITGLKLDVDDELEVKQPVRVETAAGTVEINPKFGKVIFGHRE